MPATDIRAAASDSRRSRPQRHRRAAQTWREYRWHLLAILTVAAFVLGIVGFSRWFDLHDYPGGFWDAAYRSLQLFDFESGAVDPPVPLTLGIGRYLAIVATLYAAFTAVVSVFGERISRFRLRLAKGHAVVCGLGDRGLYITERLLERNMRVAVIERDEHAPFIDQARELGAVVMLGDASDAAVLRRVRADRARYLVAVAADDGHNAAIAVRLVTLASGRPPSAPLTVVAHIADTELCELLHQQSGLEQAPGGLRLAFFNVPESGARAMLEEVPPVALDGTNPPHVVIVGLGKLGRSLAIQIARTWWAPQAFGGRRPRITLIDQAAVSKAELLRVRCPGIEEVCDLDIRQMEKNAPEFERGDFLYEKGRLNVDAVYVCPDDDVHSLVSSLALLRHTRGSGAPIAVRMTREAGFADLVDERGPGGAGFSDLHVVGILDATCDLEVLLGGDREVIARAIHYAYARHERAAGHTVADNPAMVQWRDLPETLRESNRCQADDIRVKLESIGRRIVPLDHRCSRPEGFDDGEIERLARDEHVRWMRERESQQWTYGPAKDLSARKSPDLCPWEELTEEAREKDRQAVRSIPEVLARAGLMAVHVLAPSSPSAAPRPA